MRSELNSRSSQHSWSDGTTSETRSAGTHRENAGSTPDNPRQETTRIEATNPDPEAQALHFARHDALTGLPNRLALLNFLQDGITESKARQSPLALIHIDIDNFKMFNVQYGHVMGDKLLAVIAQRIRACVGANGMTGRYGGDEFVVMLTNFDDVKVASALTAKIRTRIDGRYGIDGIVFFIKTSVVLALCPADGDNCAALLGVAERALSRSKASNLHLDGLAGH